MLEQMHVYMLHHGWGPGTIPNDVKVLDHLFKEISIGGPRAEVELVIINRPLTKEELDFYDLTDFSQGWEEMDISYKK